MLPAPSAPYAGTALKAPLKSAVVEAVSLAVGSPSVSASWVVSSTLASLVTLTVTLGPSSWKASAWNASVSVFALTSENLPMSNEALVVDAFAIGLPVFWISSRWCGSAPLVPPVR